MADRAIVERAIQRTRRHARRELAIVAPVLLLFLAYPGSSLTITLIVVSLNVLVSGFLARRLYRLRASGPVVKALLEEPAHITSIHQWPPKLPPKKLPAMLDIQTRDGAVGSLLLDPKAPGDTAALVSTLRARSPEAVVVYPATSVV